MTIKEAVEQELRDRGMAEDSLVEMEEQKDETYFTVFYKSVRSRTKVVNFVDDDALIRNTVDRVQDLDNPETQV